LNRTQVLNGSCVALVPSLGEYCADLYMQSSLSFIIQFLFTLIYKHHNNICRL